MRKKSHLVINFCLMKRSQDRKMQEISEFKFVELAGSEQTVAEEQFIRDTSVRTFVTKSFNSLSSQMLRVALKKRQTKSIDEGESPLMNSLRSCFTVNSNIVFVCNVNPAPAHFEHSLPALKFSARIRDCIVKKLGRGQELC